ncbi:MAG: OmpA family protein, partial [Acidobacteria bacterium]|nr:OmpA family protein [Acidobacteriota bacterium]
MKKALIFAVTILCLFIFVSAFAQQKDAKECKDHPLFPKRMPGDYWIYSCKTSSFDFFDFYVAKGKTERAEGQLWRINYYTQATATQKPSELEIQRNYENAATSAGGTVIYSEKGRSTIKLIKDNKEIWVQVSAEFTGKYSLIIVQKEAMTQSVVVDSAAISNGLKATGHIAIYGITFDTDSAVIKPESAQAVGEIAQVLKSEPNLKIYVVGHTDNTGTADHNLKLSQDRANSVMQELINKHGIAAARLK